VRNIPSIEMLELTNPDYRNSELKKNQVKYRKIKGDKLSAYKI